MFDLSILTNEKNCADMITNYGTTEHVEKEKGQYACWVNIHNMLRVDGLIIHALPLAEKWEGHCRWHYTPSFFSVFEEYGYKIQKLELTWHDLVFCKMVKVSNTPFMDYEKFMNAVTFIGGEIPKGNNPKRII